jgi:hypothetical protein
MSSQILSILAVAAAISACAVSTRATLLDPSLRLARTCPTAVRLYTDRSSVEQPYREIALISSVGETEISDEGDLIESMREKAARVGANGIILGRIDEPNAITKVAGAVAKVGVDRTGHALAIFVPSDSARTASTCAERK